jgi:hypothetical protein
MSDFRILKLSLSEDFPALRFCAAAIVAAFTAVVTVYKLIDISDAVSSGYTAPETVMLIFTDIINCVFIYTPLYLFIIESAVTRQKFGVLDIVKSGSRIKIAVMNFIKVIFYTVIFFILLLIINGATSAASFPVVFSWSQAFAGTSTLFGYGINTFGSEIMPFIISKLAVIFLSLTLCGMINTVLSDAFKKQEYAFPVTAVAGIGLSLLALLSDIPSSSLILFIGAAIALLFIADLLIVRKKDY